MNFIKILPKIIKYKLSRMGIIKTPMPLVLTYSVTNMCQSKCKTCNIWKLYKTNPELKNKELTLDEIEKIFKSIGHVYFFNISGGEPFLRRDLPEIVELACKYLTPDIIHAPTNGINPLLIEKQTKKIMNIIKKYNPKLHFTIKPSFDSIEEKHDKIRGINGNFKNVLETIKRLRLLEKDYPNLHIGIGTVISKFNLEDIGDIADYANKLNVDSYIHEIAEQRSELFTLNSPITPTAEEYKIAINKFINKTKKKNKKLLDRITQAFRIVYYYLALKIIKEKKQVIPCYSGLSNVHINPYGQVWACSILAYQYPMGDLRKHNYDFKKVWCSEEAKKVRKFIKDKKCYCPMAGVSYSNILFNIREMIKVVWYLMFK